MQRRQAGRQAGRQACELNLSEKTCDVGRQAGRQACELNLLEKQMRRGQADEKSMERLIFTMKI
jgi:hypothetical protein